MEQDPREKGRGQAEAWADKAAAVSVAVTEPGRGEDAFAPNAVQPYPMRLEPLVIKEHVQNAALR